MILIILKRDKGTKLFKNCWQKENCPYHIHMNVNATKLNRELPVFIKIGPEKNRSPL